MFESLLTFFIFIFRYKSRWSIAGSHGNCVLVFCVLMCGAEIALVLLYMLGKYSAAELLTQCLGGCASIRMGMASSVFQVWRADVAVGFCTHPVAPVLTVLSRSSRFTPVLLPPAPPGVYLLKLPLFCFWRRDPRGSLVWPEIDCVAQAGIGCFCSSCLSFPNLFYFTFVYLKIYYCCVNMWQGMLVEVRGQLLGLSG